MKLQLVAITVFAALLVSVTLAGTSFAQTTSKNDIKSIMDNYRKAIQKAQADFQAAIKKVNADAKDAVLKGLPIDQINSDSKSKIQKARVDLKASIDKARVDAKNSLLQLKAAIDAKAS
jgi:hypothetical protein